MLLRGAAAAPPPRGLAGAEGFEPSNTGSKVPRLTAWPRPIVRRTGRCYSRAILSERALPFRLPCACRPSTGSRVLNESKGGRTPGGKRPAPRRSRLAPSRRIGKEADLRSGRQHVVQTASLYDGLGSRQVAGTSSGRSYASPGSSRKAPNRRDQRRFSKGRAPRAPPRDAD